MDDSLTLQDFFDALPTQLSEPFNTWLGGSMLTRGKVNPCHDIDLFIDGNDDRTLVVLEEIRASVPPIFRLTVFNRPPIIDNPTLPFAQLHVGGVKVSKCPDVPIYDRRNDRVRYEDFDALDARVRKLEGAK
jgi:hypothetical protein